MFTYFKMVEKEIYYIVYDSSFLIFYFRILFYSSILKQFDTVIAGHG